MLKEVFHKCLEGFLVVRVFCQALFKDFEQLKAHRHRRLFTSALLFNVWKREKRIHMNLMQRRPWIGWRAFTKVSRTKRHFLMLEKRV